MIYRFDLVEQEWPEEECCEFFRGDALISQKVFIKSFCKSQFSHKPVTLSLILLM